MQHYLKHDWPVFLAFIALTTIVSCTNDNKQQTKDEAKTDTSQDTPAQPQQTKTFTISGTLDTLYTDSLSFANLKNGKMVFSFIFSSTDKLTLHGWHYKGPLGGPFDPNPDLELKNGGATAYMYGPDVYFGNIVVKNVDDIQKALKKYHSKYVLFVPQPVASKNITYKIYVTTDDPSALKALATTYTGVDANPSPPKTY